MPDQTLEILIKMQSDMTALKASVSEIDSLKQKIKQLETEHESGARAAHKHAGGHRELHRLMHAVGHQSPILGLALRAVFSPLGALIMAGVVALEAFMKMLERTSKQFEAFGKLAADAWEASHKGAINAAKVTSEYTEHLKDAAAAHEKITEKYEKDKTILAEVIKAHKELLDAMEAEEIANAQKAGDKEQEETIKKRFELLKRTNELASEQKQQQLRIGVKQSEEMAFATSQDQGAEARRRLKEFQTGRSPITVAHAQEAMKEEELGKIEGRLRENKADLAQAQKLGFLPLTVAARKSDIAKDEKKLAAYHQNEALVEAYNKELERLQVAVRRAAAEEDKHREALEKVTKEIETEGKVYNIHKSSAFSKTNIGKAEDAFSTAEDAAQKFKKGGKLSASEDSLLRSVASVFAGTSVNTQTAAAMLNTALTSTDLQAKYMEKILRIMESTANTLKPFGKRLEDLERRIQTQNTNATH